MCSLVIFGHVLFVIGVVRRRCIRNGQWDEFIECFKEETKLLFDQVTVMMATYSY